MTVGEDADEAWRASVEAAVQLPTISPKTEAAAYHIAVEALTNAYRHSGGDRADVRIGVDTGGAAASRSRLPTTGADSTGMAASRVGLRSMRERAGQVGGHLEVSNRPGGGTIVRGGLPLEVAGASSDPEG